MDHLSARTSTVLKFPEVDVMIVYATEHTMNNRSVTTSRLNVETYQERRNVKAVMITLTAIIAGLGFGVGFPIIKVDGARDRTTVRREGEGGPI